MADNSQMPSRGNSGDSGRTVDTRPAGSDRGGGRSLAPAGTTAPIVTPPSFASSPIYVPGQSGQPMSKPRPGDYGNPWAVPVDGASDPAIDTTQDSNSDGPIYGQADPFAILADVASRIFGGSESSDEPQTTYVPVVGSGGGGGAPTGMIVLFLLIAAGAGYYFLVYKKKGASNGGS